MKKVETTSKHSTVHHVIPLWLLCFGFESEYGINSAEPLTDQLRQEWKLYHQKHAVMVAKSKHALADETKEHNIILSFFNYLTSILRNKPQPELLQAKLKETQAQERVKELEEELEITRRQLEVEVAYNASLIRSHKSRVLALEKQIYTKSQVNTSPIVVQVMQQPTPEELVELELSILEEERELREAAIEDNAIKQYQEPWRPNETDIPIQITSRYL